jgi:Raf kinase inhibitor-like YbhB/YbcL family protein
VFRRAMFYEVFCEVNAMADLVVKSPVFENNKPIPKKYSCDGEEVNPPLTVECIPDAAKTLALIVDDPDAPRGIFDHWVVWNISPTGKIEEKMVPGTEGLNGAGQQGYVGMCPPSGTHRYFFKVYALDVKLDLQAKATKKKDLEKAMQGHILAKGELVGLYRR